MNEHVTIMDYGRPEYLDGAAMQFAVYLGDYPSGHCVAYCDTLDVARVLANALSEVVIIQTS